MAGMGRTMSRSLLYSTRSLLRSCGSEAAANAKPRSLGGSSAGRPSVAPSFASILSRCGEVHLFCFEVKERDLCSESQLWVVNFCWKEWTCVVGARVCKTFQKAFTRKDGMAFSITRDAEAITKLWFGTTKTVNSLKIMFRLTWMVLPSARHSTFIMCWNPLLFWRSNSTANENSMGMEKFLIPLPSYRSNRSQQRT